MLRSSRLKGGQLRFGPLMKARKRLSLRSQILEKESNRMFCQGYSKHSNKARRRRKVLAWDWRSPERLLSCMAAEFMHRTKKRELALHSLLSLKLCCDIA